MKRGWLITLGVVLLLPLFFWGYITYRQYRSFQTAIPERATSLIRINMDALIRDIAWNALRNRGEYAKRGEEKTGIDIPGVTIPANLFLYRLDLPSQAFANIYFGSIPLTDTANFSRWLSEHLQLEIQQDSLGTVAFSSHMAVIYNHEHAFVALSPEKLPTNPAALRQTLTALSTSTKTIAVGDSRFREIRQAKGHISFAGKRSSSLTFGAGKIVLSGLSSPVDHSLPEQLMPDFPASNVASLWLPRIPSSLLAGKLFTIGSHTLHGDSLLHHIRGDAILEWKGTTIQQDTIITYEYDDDFVMQERQTTVEKKVPALYLSISADSTLRRYLLAQGILAVDGHQVNREIFPLYQISAHTTSIAYFQFHTTERPTKLPTRHASTGKDRYLYIDFERIDQQLLPSALIPYIQVCDQLEINGITNSFDESEGPYVECTLHMKDRKINSLVQLIAAATNQSSLENP